MDVSKFLAKVIGIYLVIVTLMMLTNMSQFLSNVNSLVNDAPLMFVTGFFTLILGILVVVSHNIWQWNWRVIITIFAWLALIKGAVMLVYPQLIDSVSYSFIQNTTIAYVTACVDLVLGLVLCYFGFRR